MSRRDEDLPLSPLKPVDQDVAGEVAFHLEQRTAELIAEGWDAAAARQEAERIFGDPRAVAQEMRAITERTRRTRRRADAWYAFGYDLAYAVRLLRKAPGFTVAAILTLALGIGANAAIFSVVNGTLLRPLPYPDADRLVYVRESHRTGWGDLPWTNFLDVRAESRSFASMTEYGSFQATVLGADAVVRVPASVVSEDFFRVLGVTPFLGRVPAPDEHVLGAAPVCVVSYRFWRDYLGGRRDLAGMTLRTAFALQVVGVMPPGFNFPDDADLWYPMELVERSPSRTAHGNPALGRLRDGVTPEAARRDVAAILRRLGEANPDDFDATGAIVTGLQDQLTGSMQQPLYLLLGAAGVLLLAACTNLASAVLARGTARQSELAVRAALGASRTRLVRQLFTEGLVLALLGAVAGLGVAAVLLRALLALAPAGLAGLDAVRLDGRVLGFALVLGLVTSVVFGLLPALRASTADPGAAMREGARAGSGPGRHRIWGLLIAAEVALTVVLLTGSGLLIRSFVRMVSLDPGFSPSGVLTVEVSLPALVYDSLPKAVTYYDRALAALAAVPGVDHVGVTNVLPLGGSQPNGLSEVEGKPINWPDFSAAVPAVYRLASPDYFAAMGMRIERGRPLGADAGPSTPHEVVVTSRYAAQAWPGDDPIGKRMRPAGMDPVFPDTWATVVGVVGDARLNGLTDGAPRPAYFALYSQRSYRIRSMTFVVKSRLGAAALARPVREALRRVDPGIPAAFRTMDDVVGDSLADRRFTLVVLASFAGLALLLAGVGIYGVVSYAVAQRTRDIGIRLALGASPGAVRRQVQARALTAAGLGGAAGLLGAALVTRALASLLYQVSPFDPLTLAGVAALLAATVWLASWVPAHRGSRLDPVSAIRTE